MKPLPNQDYSRTLLTTMKDEAPYMLDWIAYHLSIGFTHFVILTNDCSDGTERLARQLEKVGVVTQKNNPGPYTRGPQKNGYLRMRRLDAVQNAKWLMTLDVDEYLRIDVADQTLDGLFDVVGPDVNAISFVWQLFGHNGVINIDDRPVTEQFTRCGHELQARPYEAMPIKTLYQNGFFNKIGTHRPNDLRSDRADDLLWIDADGVPLNAYHKQRHWRSYENGLGFGTTLGRINHYALRSLDAFLVKWARGFVHPDAPTVRGKGTARDYWSLFDWNTRSEERILNRNDHVQNWRESLLQVGNVAKIHEKAVKWHQERAKHLLDTQPMIAKAKDEIIALKQIPEAQRDMPDFSQYGSPKSGNTQTVPLANLATKAVHHGRLSDELLAKGLYREWIVKPE